MRGCLETEYVQALTTMPHVAVNMFSHEYRAPL